MHNMICRRKVNDCPLRLGAATSLTEYNNNNVFDVIL